MHRVYIVGNPNSGKTTLFNKLTKSSEHIGNWHGVTVDKKSKIIAFQSNNALTQSQGDSKSSQKAKPQFNKVYEIVDLPGIYSLNAFSLEEQVSIDEITKNDAQILYLLDANNFKRGMLLALNLLLLNKNIKILINNYKSFQKKGGSIDTAYLNKVLGCEVEIIDALKFKATSNFFEFNTRRTAFITALQNEIGVKNIEPDFCIDDGKSEEDKGCENNKCKICNKNNLNNQNNLANKSQNKINKNNAKLKIIEILYEYILKISNNCVKNNNQIYGYSKLDDKFLNIAVYLPMFILAMFCAIFITFFIVGPFVGDIFLNVLFFTIQKPIMHILNIATNSRFILSLFNEGVFGACFSVLGFLPQIALMYLFLSILENSGLISRFAFLLDDFLTKVGLNGKMVYTMLMGLGCSTTATLSAKNMQNKRSQIKASLLTPFISCSAKLPIYITVGGAIMGAGSVWLIFGLYMLGLAMAIVLAVIFERTILPSVGEGLVLEFPPLKSPNLKVVWLSTKTSCKQFIVKVFGVIFGASVILWLLSNVNIKFQFVGEVDKSILYSFSSIISWAFKPIGLNNPNIICALLVGLVAKELILSSFAISNKVSNLSLLGASLVLSSSAVNFTTASGISFLVFVLLYLPCISNFGVLLKEVGVKFTLFGVGIQFALAYVVSWLAYTLIAKGVLSMLALMLVICVIIFSAKIIYKKIKLKKIFCSCNNCVNN